MHDAIVIGGGLFGRTITHALRAQGRDVVLLDNQEKEAGSRPAACLMKPSWFSSMGAEKYEPSLRLLDELFGVKDIQFDLIPTRGFATVHWCDPQDILSGGFTPTAATDVAPGRVTVQGGEVLEARLVVVAAGIWTEKLLPQYKQTAQAGMAFLYSQSHLQKPFIQPWAPYRQLVAFNRGDGLWVGDGTAIKRENWNQEREETSYERCHQAVSKPLKSFIPLPEPTRLFGIRPYAKGHKPCLLEEVSPGLWVASGGAKNGTIAAGYCAHVIREKTS